MKFKVFQSQEEPEALYFDIKQASDEVRFVVVNTYGIEFRDGALLTINRKGVFIDDSLIDYIKNLVA